MKPADCDKRLDLGTQYWGCLLDWLITSNLGTLYCYFLCCILFGNFYAFHLQQIYRFVNESSPQPSSVGSF